MFGLLLLASVPFYSRDCMDGKYSLCGYPTTYSSGCASAPQNLDSCRCEALHDCKGDVDLACPTGGSEQLSLVPLSARTEKATSDDTITVEIGPAEPIANYSSIRFTGACPFGDSDCSDKFLCIEADCTNSTACSHSLRLYMKANGPVGQITPVAIAGIIAGSSLCLILIVSLIIYLMKRRIAKHRQERQKRVRVDIVPVDLSLSSSFGKRQTEPSTPPPYVSPRRSKVSPPPRPIRKKETPPPYHTPRRSTRK